jgi:hypothetical protein
MPPRKVPVETVEITPAGRAALLEPETPEVVEATVALHELDEAPIGSKLVSTEQGVVLARPDGGEGKGSERMLPRSDLAGRLPTGARIQKIGDGVYRAVQLDATVDHPALITATAIEAIQQFVPHFHG